MMRVIERGSVTSEFVDLLSVVSDTPVHTGHFISYSTRRGSLRSNHRRARGFLLGSGRTSLCQAATCSVLTCLIDATCSSPVNEVRSG